MYRKRFFYYLEKFLREQLFFDLLFRERDMILLVLRMDLFLPSPKFFRIFSVSTFFADNLSFLRAITTSPITGMAISNKYSPILFAAGTIYFLMKRILVLP